MNIAPATAIASELPGRTNRRETIRARLKIWWRELDHVLLGLIVILIAVGCAAISAASPAGAARLSSDEVTLNPLRFLFLHLRWLAVGVPAMIGSAMMVQGTWEGDGVFFEATGGEGFILASRGFGIQCFKRVI